MPPVRKRMRYHQPSLPKLRTQIGGHCPPTFNPSITLVHAFLIALPPHFRHSLPQNFLKFLHRCGGLRLSLQNEVVYPILPRLSIGRFRKAKEFRQPEDYLEHVQRS